jgi:ribosome-binding protein aMBF1 (putative translation factor)
VQKPSNLQSPTVTVADLEAAVRVLSEMPNLLDHSRVASQMAFERIAKQVKVSPSVIRDIVSGKAPQGMSTKSLLAILPWIAQQLPRVSITSV